MSGTAAAASSVSSIFAVGECGDASDLVPLAGDEERERAAETESEQSDRLVSVVRPLDRVSNVGALAVALVPVAVVESEAVDSLLTERVRDGPEPFVAAVAAVLRVWRARDHAGVCLVWSVRLVSRTVQRPANVSRTRNEDCLAISHGRKTVALTLESIGARGVAWESITPPTVFAVRRGIRIYLIESQWACMGILSRASYVVRSKVNSLLNRAEDPSETLDYSYEQMRDELQEVKQGIADLTTQKKRLEIQKRDLEDDIEKHNEQAREAVQQDREDLARKALEKKKSKMSQLEDLEGQIQDLQNTQDQLVEKKSQLQNRIEEFKTKKETMKARYDAAEASNRVSEAMSGVGDEMEDVGRAIERAEERTEEMEARSEAMDELQASGTFDDALSDGDEIDQELQQGRSDREVESELETLRSEVGKSNGDGGGADTDTEADTETADVSDDLADEEIEAELEELKDDGSDDSSN
jgi:phage shock protein A